MKLVTSLPCVLVSRFTAYSRQ